MISAFGTVLVDAEPKDVLEMVLDLKAYMQLDHKIVRVYDNPPVDENGDGWVVFRASMRGLRSPKQHQRVKLERWTSLEFTSDGPWLADLTSVMRGNFHVEPTTTGTRVTHSYEFRFKGPVGWLIERHSGTWLQRDVDAELIRMQRHFGNSS